MFTLELSFLFCFRDTGDILLKVCNLMPQDTGIYTCVAVNNHGSASSSASIKVQGRCLTSSNIFFPQLLYWQFSLIFFFSPCRYPSSPWEASGAGGQQHSGHGALATPSFICSLLCEQLHCGVPTGGYELSVINCEEKDYFLHLD